MHDTVVYQLPAAEPAPAIAPALLPTPQAKLADAGPDYARATRPGSGGDDLTTTVARTLLPTPRASDSTKGSPRQRGSSGDLTLTSAVHLLPTPSVADALGGHRSRSGPRRGELLLPGIAQTLGAHAIDSPQERLS